MNSKGLGGERELLDPIMRLPDPRVNPCHFGSSMARGPNCGPKCEITVSPGGSVTRWSGWHLRVSSRSFVVRVGRPSGFQAIIFAIDVALTIKAVQQSRQKSINGALQNV